MRKLALLRAHLVAAVPGLARDPDRLLTFVESGSIEFHRSGSQPHQAPAAYSHQYTAPVRLELRDYTGELDAIIVPLLQWLSHYQPDLDPTAAVTFDAEIIDAKTVDLSITVTLTERVVAPVDCATGRIEAEHRLPEYPVDACPAKHWSLYLRGPEHPDPHLLTEWDSQ